MELVIFVGLPSSGKHIFYEHNFATSHVLIREGPLARVGQRVAYALRHGKSVVVCKCNPTLEGRAELINIAKAYRAFVSGFYFNSPLGDCLRRNRSYGPAKIPEFAIVEVRDELEPPSLLEGYNRLWSVTYSSNYKYTVKWMADGIIRVVCPMIRS